MNWTVCQSATYKNTKVTLSLNPWSSTVFQSFASSARQLREAKLGSRLYSYTYSTSQLPEGVGTAPEDAAVLIGATTEAPVPVDEVWLRW